MQNRTVKIGNVGFRLKETKVSSDRAKEVANIIAQQLGGVGLLKAMVGAKDFTADTAKCGGPIFKFSLCKKANYCKIILNAWDTYDVYFYKSRSTELKEVAKFEGYYDDMLQDCFQDFTGLTLIKPRIVRI